MARRGKSPLQLAQLAQQGQKKKQQTLKKITGTQKSTGTKKPVPQSGTVSAAPASAPKREAGTIFVSLASFCDPWLQFTIESIFSKAADPNQLILGIIDQSFESLSSWINQHPRVDQIRYLHIDPLHSRGVCWARSLAQTLFDHEDYYLQIDSHTWFEPNWDALLIRSIQQLKQVTERPLLTIYPPPFEFDAQLQPFVTINVTPNLAYFTFKNPESFSQAKPVIKVKVAYHQAPDPQQTCYAYGHYLAGGFIFTLGHFVQEVPYDPYFYFHGEEQGLALRAYTHGWDIFHSRFSQVPLYHLYKAPNIKHNSHHWRTDLEARRPVKAAQRRAQAEKRLLQLVNGQLTAPYGLGTQRSLADYIQHSGIDYLTGTLNPPSQPKVLQLDIPEAEIQSTPLIKQPVAIQNLDSALSTSNQASATAAHATESKIPKLSTLSEQVFGHIFQTNTWGNKESVSGPGSARVQTAEIERLLPSLLKDLNIHSLLDIPSGDFNWMQHVELNEVSYLGGDVVLEVVERNRCRYSCEQRQFILIDLLESPLPRQDALFSRDVLVHFDFASIWKFFANWYLSEIPYLITTHFTDRDSNRDIKMGQWRPLNLCAAPFNLPAPLHILVEKCTESQGCYADKTLSVWSREQLTEFFNLPKNETLQCALESHQRIRENLASKKALVLEARAALEKNQPALTQRLLANEIANLHFDFEANHLLGIALAMQKQLPPAFDYLRRASNLNPQDEKALYNLLRLAVQYQKPQLVKTYLPLYQQQVKTDPLVEKA